VGRVVDLMVGERDTGFVGNGYRAKVRFVGAKVGKLTGLKDISES
jgi:hypothetical protein